MHTRTISPQAVENALRSDLFQSHSDPPTSWTKVDGLIINALMHPYLDSWSVVDRWLQSTNL